MGCRYGFVQRRTDCDGDLEAQLDAWAQFCREFYFEQFVIALDNQLYWFGNMEDPGAYHQTETALRGTEVIKDNELDNDTVVIHRIGNWDDWQQEIAQRAALLDIGLDPSVSIEELKVFHPGGSIVYGYNFDHPQYSTLHPNTAYRLQYEHVADFSQISHFIADCQELFGEESDAGSYAKYMAFVADIIKERKLLYEIQYSSVSYGDASAEPLIPWPRLQLDPTRP